MAKEARANVTLDKVVKNVGTFGGNLKEGRRDYERAKQGIEIISKESEVLEDALKRASGYSEYHLPKESVSVEFVRGDVAFNVKSEKTTKRPQYKSAVIQMENYLNGISFLISEGRIITGVAKEEDKWFINTKKLLESYEVIAAGIMLPDIKQTITYEVHGELAGQSSPSELNLKGRTNKRSLSEGNFTNYAMMTQLKQDLEKYVKDYESALPKERGEEVTQVSIRNGYAKTKTTSEGVNWGYVVKTLLQIKENDEDGELNILADERMSLGQRRKALPFYEIMLREAHGKTSAYVSLDSVYNRIQDLKEQEVIKSKRTKVVAQEIV